MNEGALPELPGGWVWTRMENCIEILDSQRIPINAEEREKRIAGRATSELYPYYGATGQVGWIDDYLFDEELILLGEDGAPFFESAKNKAYIIKGKSWVNNHAHVLKAIAGVTLNQFLCHYLNIFDYNGYVTGTTRAKLNQSPMRKIPIPLSPLPEQRRIVTKLEELFTKLDAGVSALQKVQARLKRYRQSVLKAACEGKLVPTEAELAKNEGRAYEPADVLLARILKERREKWKGKGKYKESAALETSDLPELTEGWVWARFDVVCNKIQDGSHFSPKIQYNTRVDGTYLYITAKNIRENGMDLSDVTYVDSSFHNSIYERCNPEKGDVLLTKDGVKTGIAAINTIDEEFSLLSSVALFKSNKNILNSYYLKHFLNSPIGFKMTTGQMTGTAIKRIILEKIRTSYIPLPPLAEQRRIVSEVERRLSVADEVARTVEQSLAQADRLRQSILKKAFEGKLVAQDARDEPASVLLEKIRLQKQLEIKKGRSKR